MHDISYTNLLVSMYKNTFMVAYMYVYITMSNFLKSMREIDKNVSQESLVPHYKPQFSD